MRRNILFSAVIMIFSLFITPWHAHGLTISGSKVGIGTDTPAESLDVVGNVKSNGNVDATSFTGGGAGLTNISGDHITSGTIFEGLIDSSIARDSEVTSAISDHTSNPSAHHTRYTDSEAVNAVKAADGSGSGLDADLLDGQHASSFASSTHNHDGNVFFRTANTPGLWFTNNEESHSDALIELTGPRNVIVDYGATATCEATGGLTSFVRVFPTLDDQVVSYGALLSTKGDNSASIANAEQLFIPAGTHTLGLGAIGKAFGAGAPGCSISYWWIKGILLND